MKKYKVIVSGSSNDGIYTIEAYSKSNAINKIRRQYNTSSQKGTEYYVTEL